MNEQVAELVIVTHEDTITHNKRVVLDLEAVDKVLARYFGPITAVRLDVAEMIRRHK
jgi:hypothetical protein